MTRCTFVSGHICLRHQADADALCLCEGCNSCNRNSSLQCNTPPAYTCTVEGTATHARDGATRATPLHAGKHAWQCVTMTLECTRTHTCSMHACALASLCTLLTTLRRTISAARICLCCATASSRSALLTPAKRLSRGSSVRLTMTGAATSVRTRSKETGASSYKQQSCIHV